MRLRLLQIQMLAVITFFFAQTRPDQAKSRPALALDIVLALAIAIALALNLAVCYFKEI